MKKVFMPSMDELYEMQDMNANVYKYLVVKAVESIICDGINYPCKGMLKNAYMYLQEDPEIARAVCTLYPDEMEYSKISSTDIELCNRLINGSDVLRDCGLDYLCRFTADVTSNNMLFNKVVVLLEKELRENPKYRFEYAGSDLHFVKRGTAKVINDILDRKIGDNELMLLIGNMLKDVVKTLIKIEPAYVLSIHDGYLKMAFSEHNRGLNKGICLDGSINSYADRYGISKEVGLEYYGQDILTNPSTDVKRLIRCIKDRNK